MYVFAFHMYYVCKLVCDSLTGFTSWDFNIVIQAQRSYLHIDCMYER